MLRKMRFTAPPERFDDLVAAARHASLELSDYFIDTAEEAARYGWPMAGDGNACVIGIVDDAQEADLEIEASLRAAHTALTGQPAVWLHFAKSYVYLPDGLEYDWYQAHMPLVTELHAAEDRFDLHLVEELRAAFAKVIEPALAEAAESINNFKDGLVFAGAVSINDI